MRHLPSREHIPCWDAASEAVFLGCTSIALTSIVAVSALALRMAARRPRSGSARPRSISRFTSELWYSLKLPLTAGSRRLSYCVTIDCRALSPS